MPFLHMLLLLIQHALGIQLFYLYEVYDILVVCAYKNELVVTVQFSLNKIRKNIFIIIAVYYRQ